MTGYTIIYWGDSEEVAYLDWAACPNTPGEADHAAQFERIMPAFARFLTANQITEVLEHNPHDPLNYDQIRERIKYWEDQLIDQGYPVTR